MTIQVGEMKAKYKYYVGGWLDWNTNVLIVYVWLFLDNGRRNEWN